MPGWIANTVRHTALLSLEVLVCPAFLPNLVRKITTARPVEADGAQILLTTASGDVKEEFLAGLSSRAEELINEAAGRMQFQIEQLAEVVADHGIFEGAPDLRASVAAVDAASGRSGLFPDIDVPISAEELQQLNKTRTADEKVDDSNAGY